jgi:hypothetical protein
VTKGEEEEKERLRFKRPREDKPVCAPRFIKKGFKTVLPRSIQYLPKFSEEAVTVHYIETHPGVRCPTVAMLWKMRSKMTPTEFAKWYRDSAKTPNLQADAPNAIAAFEKWYATAPRPTEEEAAADPGADEPQGIAKIHSGWLIDIPGFNPKRGERFYADTLGYDDLYELVHHYKKKKYGEDEKAIAKAITHLLAEKAIKKEEPKKVAKFIMAAELRKEDV